MHRNVHTFIGCDAEYDAADLVIFGAPFDATTSYRPGARFAGAAMRGESYGLETYSPYQDRDLSELAVFDGGELELPFGNPGAALAVIEAYTENVLKDNKMPVMLGGEHLVTLGAVRAVTRHNPELQIIHFDAHADLREGYMGETLSHASVIRRCWELLGDKRIHQFGIRSGEREEFAWGKAHVHTQRFNFDGLESAAEGIGDAPVYLTIDLDVLDPSVLPGTGTPEAGGVTFMELLNACFALKHLNIVGLDIVELAPNLDTSGASTAAACKLLRELLLMSGK
jgi:agmatinase